MLTTALFLIPSMGWHELKGLAKINIHPPCSLLPPTSLDKWLVKALSCPECRRPGKSVDRFHTILYIWR